MILILPICNAEQTWLNDRSPTADQHDRPEGAAVCREPGPGEQATQGLVRRTESPPIHHRHPER